MKCIYKWIRRCGGCNPLWQYELLYSVKYKNDMHAPTALQKPFTLFGLWTTKFWRHDLVEEFFINRLLTCIIDDEGGVVGATPEGMSHYIL